MDDDEGVDCEIEEMQKKPASEMRFERDLSSKEVMSSDDLHNASDKRHTHRRHHRRSKDQRKQRYSDTDGNYQSDLDKHNSGHLKRHTDNQNEPNHGSNATSKNFPRAHQSQGSTQQHSKQNAKHYTQDEPLETAPAIVGKAKRDLHGTSLKWSESGDKEEGEILEDGELADDKEATEKPDIFATKEHIEGVNRERKKSGNRNKRNHKTDMKRRRHNYADEDGEQFQDGKHPGPTWGSSYQMSNRRMPAFPSMKQGYGQGSKGHSSPPGLYDSPSGGSDEELVSKTLMSGAYIDASVAADEKQGIFDRKVNLGKRKKRKYERNENKRGQNGGGSFEGPPKKKSLLDMHMSERPACKFYMEGKCAKAGMCPFNHDVEKTKKMEVCKYHLTVIGCHKASCPFMHTDFPCKYYHTGAKCFSGDTCKFSHDPLTEGSRKALEMRVAAEDIIGPGDSSNNEHRQREMNNKPSLLGSPPRLGPELRRIPSLFEIEVHPPGQSPKPPLPQTVRPSGFYSETNAASVSGPINNVGLMKSVIASNLNSQQQRGGAGLLQLPVRPGNMNGFMGSVMGNQGLNPGHQRFATAPSLQIKNNQQPQNGHLSPVLNMLGAIIREAATQKGPDGQSNMLPKMSMGVNNMNPSLNTVLSNVDHNTGGHTKMPSDNITSNTSLESFNGGFTNVGKAGPIYNANMCQDKDIESNVKLIVNSNTVSSGQQNMVREACKTDNDTSQRNVDDMEESQNISELNRLRQQIQAQIDEEEKKEIAAADGEEQIDQLKGDQLQPEKSGIKEKEDLSSNQMETVKSVEIPNHLPKTQQELFKRIQQQQLLREKELGKPKVHAAAKENESKDDWYSSDEDEEPKPKLTDVLKTLNQEPSSHTGSSSALGSHIVNPSEHKMMPSAASTFNIMQMINAIKGRSEVSKPVTVNTETTSQPLQLSLSTGSQGVDTLSPASPPIVSTSIMKSFGILHNVSNCPPPKLAVDPPVINAIPLKPLNYVAVRITLEMPRPYAQLFDSVIAADPAFKDDPRVKWHLSHIEKQVPKEPQRENSSEEKSQKPSDPRFAKGLNDPRLMKQNDPDGSDRMEGARPSDPRLNRTEAQPLPADPRLARLANGNLDPRLNRQIIQNHQNGGAMFNIRGGAMAGNGGMMGNQVCRFTNGPMNNMAAAMGSMRGPVNNLTGQRAGGVGSFSVGGHNRLLQSNGGSPNMVESVGSHMSTMGRPMNSTGGQINQMHPMNMRGPQEPSFGLEGRRLMISQENTIEDPVSQANPLRTEPSPVGPGVHNTSDPRLRRQKVLNEMHGNNDPRLRHRSTDPREQHLPVSDSGLFRMSPSSETVESSPFQGLADQRASSHTNFRPFESKLSHQREISQGLNFVQNNTVSFNTHELSKISHGREERISATDRKSQSDGLLPFPPSVASFVSDSNTDVSAVSKFDHRSDPRFRRVKRVDGQQKDSVEYSSPLGDDKYIGISAVHEQRSSGQNSYSRSLSGRDPSVRAVPIPQLPNTLHDLSLPISSFNVTESGLKVKDHFKVIDPTASPFC